MLFRSPLGVILFVILATVGITFAVVRYKVLDAYLPTGVLAAMEKLGATAATFSGSGEPGAKRIGAATAKDGPAQYLIDGPDGHSAEGPIAAGPGNWPVLISDVITGYTTRVSEDFPAEITTIRPISGCRLTPPLEGSEVGHATAGSTGLALPMLTYDDADLAAAVQDFVNRYRETGTAGDIATQALAYEVYDVAVTETRAPVYLVLESASRNLIWNLHLAPGVRIERVILLGGVHSGVANLDPVVPVEVLPGSAMADCGIEPAYPLNPGHRLLQVLADGPADLKPAAEAEFALLQDRVAAYDTWFLDSFGVQAGASRAGFGGTISLVGPQPGEADPKASYAAIEGSRIRVTQDQYFEIRGQVSAAEEFAGRVVAIATAFAYGDLANLRQGVKF
jgi:hypothetical protein